MVGWHHHLDGHEFEQTPGDSEGQGSLACCSPWGCKESDTTEQLNSNKWVNNGNITNLFEGTASVFLFPKKCYIGLLYHNRNNEEILNCCSRSQVCSL